MEVQFLAYSGCPLAAPAKKNLEQALAECGLNDFEEIDILDAKAPEDMRGWGSPTILINGQDVSGVPKGNSVSCRIYENPEGVPDVRTIVAIIRRAKSNK